MSQSVDSKNKNDTVNSTAVGIDLGTTYSCVGIWKAGSVEIISNEQGNRTTPSYVAFTDTEKFVGEAAKNQAAMNPSNTLFNAKRLIGRQYTDKVVQDDMKQWPFKIVKGDNNKPCFEIEREGKKERFFPEQISSMVLIKMKEIAEAYTGEKITKAVITVPAYFNDSQKQSTHNAGVIAGLEVLRIISEPTAAAIAYGLDDKNKSEKSQNILIYDFGGGTFDVSILTIDNGLFEVKATDGDTHLGGEDIDNIMVGYFAKEFERRTKKNMMTSDRALRRLRTACERAKRTLSVQTSATIEIDSLYDGEDFTATISQAKFNELCSHIFARTLEPLERVLTASKMSKKDIDKVILVGGSTRIPKVQEILQNFFGGKELDKSVNPDEAVAYGATVQAAILTHTKDTKLSDIVVVDVTPLSLGVAEQGVRMQHIVERGSTIPCKKSKVFSTYADNQTTIRVSIYQGERPMVKDCHKLGEFDLSGIPPAPRGVPQIEISFDVDANNLLHVTAKEISSGKSKDITITNNRDLSKEAIEKMIKDSEKYKKEDEEQSKKLDAKGKVQSYVSSLKNSLTKELKDKLSEDDAKIIETKLTETDEWLNSHTSDDVKVYDDKLKELETAINPIMKKLYENTSGTGQSQPPQQTVDKTSTGPKIDAVD